MSEITDIKRFDFQCEIKCDCGESFEWYETNNPQEIKDFKDTCPKCGIKYGMVFAPKKINVPAKGVDDFFKERHGAYV